MQLHVGHSTHCRLSLSSQPTPVPRPRGTIQLGQQLLHIWPLARIDEPTAFNYFPQPLGKTKVLRPLRLPWSVTFHDRMDHSTWVCEVLVRNTSAKNLTVCNSDERESGYDRIRTNLVHDHPESVTVRSFCRSVIANSKPIWIVQLWTHPPSSPTGVERHEGRPRSHRSQGGIGYGTVLYADNGRKTKIGETCTEVLIDEDIRLAIVISARTSNDWESRTPFKSPCTI